MATKKKILHVVHSLAKGGITTIIEELVGLNDSHDVSHDILVWKEAPENPYKFDILDLSKSQNRKQEFNTIIKSYDRIFVHSLMPFMIWPLFKRKKDVHFFQHGITFGTGKTKIVKQLYYFMVINMFGFKLICSSKFAVQKLKRKVPVFNSKQIQIIGFGIQMNTVNMAMQSDTSILKIGFAGRLVEQKKISRIFTALKQFNAEKQLEFHIAGDGPQLEKIQEQAKEFDGTKIRFVFYGFLKNMDDFYAQINTFILPSVGESFGLVVLESLSRKIPTIVFADTGACVEFIEQGVNGFVVENESQLTQRLNELNEISLRNELRENMKTMNLKDYDISGTRAKLDAL